MWVLFLDSPYHPIHALQAAVSSRVHMPRAVPRPAVGFALDSEALGFARHVLAALQRPNEIKGVVREWHPGQMGRTVDLVYSRLP